MNFFLILRILFWLSYQALEQQDLSGINQMRMDFSFDQLPQIEDRITAAYPLNFALGGLIYYNSPIDSASLFTDDSVPLNGNIFFSWWAIIAYLLLPIIIRLIVKFNTRRLMNEKQRLEKVVKQRTKEIIKQKEEIVSQRDALKQKSIELENALNAISEQNKKLELLNATKDKFFSIVAHDLKGPLNSLSSFSDLLAKYTEALTLEEIKTVSHDLHKAVRNTFHLAENLLTWARAQMDGLNYYPKPLTINDIILQNIELLETSTQNKKIKIEKNFPEGLIAYADEDHVKFVIRNFLTNAIKFTKPGKGIIKISSYYEMGMLIVEVQDNGIGMNEDQIKKVFSIDSKSTTEGTAGEKGTGLGLLLCKEFITKNGGSIYVQSTPGKGSTFGIRLLTSTAELTPAKNNLLNN